MTTVSRRRRNEHNMPCCNRKLKLSGPCFVMAMAALACFLLLSIFMLEEPDPYADRYNMPLEERANEPANFIQQVIQAEAKENEELQEDDAYDDDDATDTEDLEEDQDENEDMSTYARVALTGSHIFEEGPACSSSAIRCMVHYPAIDLKSAIVRDECLDIVFVMPGLRGNIDENVEKPYPPPKYTNQLDSQSTPLSSSDNHAVLTRCGCKARASGVTANQDRAVLVSPFLSHKQAPPHDFLLGIMDGHGEPGHVVSHYSALELPSLLMEELQRRNVHEIENSQERDAAIKTALNETFVEIDRTLPDAPSGGSTASFILKMYETLYVANVGDSQSFIAVYDAENDRVQIVYRNGLHKPHLPEERARIEGMGGEVAMPQGPGDSSRVIIHLNAFDFMALAMSRSIGDKEGRSVGLIPDPTVDVLKLDDLFQEVKYRDVFAVSASDGLFDRVPLEDIALHLAQSLYRNDTVPPLQACEQLIMKASESWIAGGMPYRDDISVAVTKILT